jgi:hypothetical protein
MNRSTNLPVPVGQATEARRERAGAQANATGPYGKVQARFDAQLLGQDGAKRGLKGGPPVLDAARAAYLDAEYSGEADRRPPAGLIKVTKV